MAKWPRDSEKDLIAFYGMPGTSAVEGKLVKVIPPFRMTYGGKTVPHLMFHKLAAPALENALKTVWEYYGRDQGKIDALGISKTAGTYNPRKISGSSKWSNHAYGAAIDINAAQNGFNMAGNIPIPMVAAFKTEGARWGGDYKDRTDPMHFEFCNSGATERTFDQWLEFYGVAKTGTDVPPALPAKNTYDEALRRVLEDEGGYTDHGRDPGGPTNFGITIHDYRLYIDAEGSAADVRNMKVAEAKIIYKSKYWDKMNCDALPAGVDYAVFDYGVNSGTGRAPTVLQRVLGFTGDNVDNVIGPATLNAARKRDPKEVINAICDERMTYLRRLPIWPTFGKGWTGRVSRVRAAALAMAAGKVSPPTSVSPADPIKPVLPATPQEPKGWWASLKALFGY